MMALNLLVVEDNPDWKKIWNYIGNLIEQGTQITWATSVQEAEIKIREADAIELSFDIVIADIFLSGARTGMDFFEILNPFYQKRFLFISSVQPEKAKKYFKVKFPEVHFLQKPFGAKQMIHELREILKISKSISSELHLENRYD